MKSFRVNVVLLGTYDVCLAIEATDAKEAAQAAIEEMKKDGIYRDGKTEIISVD